MGLFDFLLSRGARGKKQIESIYDSRDPVDFEFANNTSIKKQIWVEPACIEFEMDEHTEYRLLTHDRLFRFEFDTDNRIVFYLQTSFDFDLYKRQTSDEIVNPYQWELVFDSAAVDQ